MGFAPVDFKRVSRSGSMESQGASGWQEAVFGGEDEQSLSESEQAAQEFVGCAFRNDAKALRSMLARGQDVSAFDPQGRTALHMAADFGFGECVAVLLEAGGRAEARDWDGLTPLMRAACEGRLDCVKLLIAAGADIDAMGVAGGYAVSWAAAGHRKCAQALMEAGCEIGEGGCVGMGWAREFGWADMVEAHLERKALGEAASGAKRSCRTRGV